MKLGSLLLYALLTIFSSVVVGQGIGVNANGAPPDPSSMLDISSTTRGTLISRMTTVQRDAIASPAKGLRIYNTDCDNFNYNAGTSTSPNWVPFNPSPDVPSASGNINGTASVCQGQNNVTYSVPAVNNATSYTWSYSGTGASFSGATNPVSINFSGTATSGNLTVAGSNFCGNGTVSANYAITVYSIPAAPIPASNTPSPAQIVWNWNAVSGATGYKWNTTNDYSSATDNGTSTTYTQTGLSCNTAYTLYVWAYNNGCNSSAATLTQTTSSCFTCGSATVTDGSGNVYNTVLIGSQCWMQSNLETTKYQDGSNISSSDRVQWGVNGAPSCNASNFNGASCGILYDGNVFQNAVSPCPVGFHIPDKNEFITLLSSVSGDSRRLFASGAGCSSNCSGFNTYICGQIDNGGWEGCGSGDQIYYWTKPISNEIGWITQFDSGSGGVGYTQVVSQYLTNYNYSIRCVQ